MKKAFCSSIIFVIILIALYISAFSISMAAEKKDNELWTSFDIDYSPWKDISFGMENELRLDEDVSAFSQYYTEIGAKYKINSFLKASAYFRHKIKSEETENSFHINGAVQQDFNDFELSFRLRFQRKFPQKQAQEDYLRPKLEIAYKINKIFEPHAGAELFYHAFFKNGDRFDKMRLSLGIIIEPFKDNKFDLYYLHEEEMNVKKFSMSNVFGFKYSVSI